MIDQHLTFSQNNFRHSPFWEDSIGISTGTLGRDPGTSRWDSGDSKARDDARNVGGVQVESINHETTHGCSAPGWESYGKFSFSDAATASLCLYPSWTSSRTAAGHCIAHKAWPANLESIASACSIPVFFVSFASEWPRCHLLMVFGLLSFRWPKDCEARFYVQIQLNNTSILSPGLIRSSYRPYPHGKAWQKRAFTRPQRYLFRTQGWTQVSLLFVASNPRMLQRLLGRVPAERGTVQHWK